MRIIVFVLFILFIFTSSVFTSEIYTYTDKDGKIVILNTPVPEKYEKKAKKIESDKQNSPKRQAVGNNIEEQGAMEEYWNAKKAREEQDREEQKAKGATRETENSCQRKCVRSESSCQSGCYRSYDKYKRQQECGISCSNSYRLCMHNDCHIEY